jgi:hypothetical protein
MASIDAYGNGKLKASNCQIAGHSKGIQVGAYQVFGSDVRSDNNDFSAVIGDWIYIQAHNELWKLAVNGSYPESEWRLGQKGSTGMNGYNVKPILQ